MSQALATVDPTALTFPAEFKIDYVRVYQRQGAQNVGCDPSGEPMCYQFKRSTVDTVDLVVDHPTKDYISRHNAAYLDPTKKTWADAGYTWPKNTLVSSSSTLEANELTCLIQWDGCTA